MKSYDVAIIGAGVVGAAVARQLSRYKIKTALLDREEDVSFSAGQANSGISRAGKRIIKNICETDADLAATRTVKKGRPAL